jgi:hypothetical protein
MNASFYQARMRKIRARNEVSLAIRRGETTEAAQLMRIEYAGARGFRLQSDAARAANQAVFILGEPDMDIQNEDRLTYDGRLIRVVFIQLNRLAATIAEGVVEE